MGIYALLFFLMTNIYDVAIIGGGASCLFALQGLKNQKTLIIDANKKLGSKLLITGGGKCNFINKYIDHNNFISENPHFIKSFLPKYTTDDFLQFIKKHNIPYEERDNGKLFTLNGAKFLVDAFLKDGSSKNLRIQLNSKVTDVSKKNDVFSIKTNDNTFFAKKLIVASGGLSFPKINATNIGYEIAKKFNMKVTKLRPALTSIKYPDNIKDDFSKLSGVSITAEMTINKRNFSDQLLFTHTSFSGPLSLNTSLFIKEYPQDIIINFIPNFNLTSFIEENKNNKKSLTNLLSQYIPKSLIKTLFKNKDYYLNKIKKSEIIELYSMLNNFKISINSVDGFNKAEVTAGGVSVDSIYPANMESRSCSNLYFIGETLDITGMLGGYNLYWAWVSAKVLIDNLQK